MAEANNKNVAADAYATAAVISKFSATDRAAYAAAARKYAIAAPTSQNATFWNGLAALIDASAQPGSPAWKAAEAAIKQSGLSVSASTQSALLAWAPGLTPKLEAARRTMPTWVWLAAGAGLLYAVKAR